VKLAVNIIEQCRTDDCVHHEHDPHDKKDVEDGNERGYERVDDVPERLQFPKYAKHAKHPQKPENEDRDFYISGKKQRNMPGGNYEEIKVVPAVFDEFVFPVCVQIQ
jgi:hypothetical protein